MLNAIINNSPLFYFTQSLWRDEAFSVLVAQKPLAEFIFKMTIEPPFYYILLHYWIKIFGTGEIAIRSLSFAAFIMATILIIYWAEKLFKKSWLSIFLPILFFLNPMLIYYAFEVRTYGLYILFATLSMYAYSEKKWRLYVVSSILGFYTHTYFIFILGSQILHFIIWNYKKISGIKKLWQEKIFKASLINIIFICPWIIRSFLSLEKLKNSWYFPVDFHLVKSVLGNMFIGYEGTPWYLWRYTFYLSILMLILFLFAVSSKKTIKFTSYLILSVFLPLVLVIGISFIKPIFVNRYLIGVTISQVILIAYALESIKPKILSKILGIFILSGVIWFNMWYPQKHPKTPIRQTLMEINKLRRPQDLVYATSPLIIFETVYYSQNKSGIYLYNPTGYKFPWYIGNLAFSKEYMTGSIPTYPARAFMIKEDGSYSLSFKISDYLINTDMPAKK